MKKAFAWLEGNGIEYGFHDYKKNGVSPDKVKSWLRQASWQELVNTRGPTFRNLPPQRQQDLDARSAAVLMVEVPSLIRRPVIEAGKELLIGFDPDRYGSVLGKRSAKG